jgi:D-apionolactonase
MQILQAGNIQVSFENGALRTFKIEETEVLRMVYFAMRDANWGTYKLHIQNVEIDTTNDSFSINYDAFFEEHKTIFSSWKVAINGFSDSRIEFEIEGLALQDFQTNRAGFCVLHPIKNIAGKEVQIIHTNNKIEDSNFPKNIAPHQPFFDIKKMVWEFPNTVCQLDFEGDIFETEDQRNWGDASFKTYCTPLALPFPKWVKKGEIIHQKIIFQAQKNDNEVAIFEDLENSKSDFNIGLFVSKNTFSEQVLVQLSKLKLSHLSIEIDFEEDWENDFLEISNQVKPLNLPFQISFLLTDNFKLELESFVEFFKHKNLIINYLTLLSKSELVTNQTIIDEILVLKKQISAKIGVGTRYNFTELNRHRFEAKDADFIQFCYQPQEHAFDDLTLLENTETVIYQFESAKAIYQKPVHISPISLKRRFNPYATDKNAIKMSTEQQIDHRQKTVFLKDWTEKLKQNLAKSGVESVTIFQTHGDLGIMDENGKVFSVFEAFIDKKTL